MSIRYRQFCPVAKAAEVLGERWTILIIRELLMGSTRFSEFQRTLSQISPTLLTKRLNQLHDCGLLIRKKTPAQQRVEYFPTPAAKELLPVILGLGEWGMKWARGRMNDDELDVELLMHDFSRRIDVSQLPGGGNVLEFVFTDLSTFTHWWVVIDEKGERELCLENPHMEVDIQVRSNLRTLTEIWAGDTEFRTAKKDGRLQLSGNPSVIRTMPSWLRIGTFAHIRPAA